MTVRVPVAPAVLDWALEVANVDPNEIRDRFDVDGWITGERLPTMTQLQRFATTTGVGFGYLLLPEPPAWELPVPDFREGFAVRRPPSADLIAVLGLAQRRQDWYRDYAIGNGAGELDFVGAAQGQTPTQAAAGIRSALAFEVADRHGNWTATRKALLQGFEALGGLTIATSMVGNNTRRRLDENEFRGFALVDPIAPLVFVNTAQTLNGQIFTLAHEFAHVWQGTSGVDDEEPRGPGGSAIEEWCNAVASEILVPVEVLAEEYPRVQNLELAPMLDELASTFRCGTLVILQALHRSHLHTFNDFYAVYDSEVFRLRSLLEQQEARGGGDYYNNQPFRIGERLSRALVADAIEGRTPINEAMRLMSMKSLSTFDGYARRLGAA